MSLQSRLGQLKHKAKEIKGRLADRQRKKGYIAEEHEELEAEVFGIREGLNTFTKKGTDLFPTDEKKIYLLSLGTRMMQTGNNIGDASPFGAFYTKVGRLQLDLGQLELNHNRHVVKSVLEPMQTAVAAEFPTLTQLKKKTQHDYSEYDASQTKFANACAKVHKQGYSGSSSKVDLAKEEMEGLRKSFLSIQSQYVEALIETAAKEKEFMQPLLDMVEEQLNFHECSIELLKRALPSLQDMKQTACSRKVFGMPLAGDGVDPVLAMLCAVIARDGTHSQGIFRVAGSKVKIRTLKSELNSGTADLRTADGYRSDVHAIASLIKAYFRELPDGVLTTALYQEWKVAASKQDHNEKLYAIKALLERLPPSNYATLRFIARFFNFLATFSETTKMEASNFGIVIGPNLGFPADHATNAMFSATDSGLLSNLCEQLITYHDWLFGAFESSAELDPQNADPYSVPHAPPPVERTREGSVRRRNSVAPNTPAKPAPPSKYAKPMLHSQSDDGSQSRLLLSGGDEASDNHIEAMQGASDVPSGDPFDDDDDDDDDDDFGEDDFYDDDDDDDDDNVEPATVTAASAIRTRTNTSASIDLGARTISSTNGGSTSTPVVPPPPQQTKPSLVPKSDGVGPPPRPAPFHSAKPSVPVRLRRNQQEK